jgi:hypothetical protein
LRMKGRRIEERREREQEDGSPLASHRR